MKSPAPTTLRCWLTSSCYPAKPVAVANLLTALHIPEAARVDKRIAKTLLAENSAATPADKRLIQDAIEECTWVAALKPQTIGVAAYVDAEREVLELAVLRVSLRASNKLVRLAELIHRAIPYPVVLLLEQQGTQSLSLAHKRWSQGEAAKTVLDGSPIALTLSGDIEPPAELLAALSLASQPHPHLLAVYQSLMDAVLAAQRYALTGHWQLANTPDQRQSQRSELAHHAELRQAIADLQRQLGKATQMQKRVELNLALQKLRAGLSSSN